MDNQLSSDQLKTCIKRGALVIAVMPEKDCREQTLKELQNLGVNTMIDYSLTGDERSAPRELRQFAKDTDTIVALLVPSELSDHAWSDLEVDADHFWQILSPEVENQFIMRIRKNRSGPSGVYLAEL